MTTPKEQLESLLKKPDFKSIGNISSNPLTKLIATFALKGLYVYLIVFIITQIIVSGGASDKTPYLILTQVIFIIAAHILLMRNSDFLPFKKTVVSAATITAVFVLLDYLVINLFFNKNNLELYRYWPVYFLYLTTLALPFLRSKWNAFTSPNLKSLLTKQERTL